MGEAARREAASLLLSCRPARVEAAAPAVLSAVPQACRIGRGDKTHSDRMAEDETRDAPRPGRWGRSTSDATSFRTVSSGRSNQPPTRRTSAQREKDQRQTPTAGLSRGTKDLGQLRRFGPCWLRRTNVKLRSRQHSLLGDHQVHARATGITHPGFYGRKPWRKPNSETIITAPEPREIPPPGDTTQIVSSGYTKVSTQPPPMSALIISARVRT